MTDRSLCRTAYLIVLVLLWVPSVVFAWGFAGHRMVAEEAIEMLPADFRAWFRRHREELSDGSIEPDTVLRQRNGRREAVRHFIDLDLYGRPPFAELPRSYHAAVERYGKATVDERGTVPWTIEEKHERLVRELRAGQWREAVKTAAYASHYVADATMPLHSTKDYDGKVSGLPGIHKAVEHGVVDEWIRDYRSAVREAVRPGRATYGRDQIFAMLLESYADVPALMKADREARRRAEFESPAYARALDELARPLLVRRLVRAVEMLAAFWASAWVEAGRPVPP